MSTRDGRVTRLRSRSDVGEELIGAADAIADMAQRVQLNGPEPVYARREARPRALQGARRTGCCPRRDTSAPRRTAARR
jgi:hypothetical protein